MRRLDRVMDLILLDGFRAAPRLMWATFALTIVNGLAQATFPMGFKIFIDAAVAQDTGQLILGVAVSGVLISAFWLAASLDATNGFGLTDQMELYVSTRIAERVNSVASIEHFERPEYLEELDLLDQNRYLLRAAPRQTLTALSSLVRAVAMMALLVSVHPTIALLPLFGIAPAYAQARSVKLRQRAEEAVAERKRVADALFELTATAGPAKELRTFGLTGELVRRHAELGRSISRALSRAALGGAAVSVAGWLVFVAGFVGAITLVVQRAVDGRATVGEVVLVVVMAQQVRRLFADVAQQLAALLTTVRTASRAMWLEDYAAKVNLDSSERAAPRRLTEGIRFDAVTFRYPGTETDVLVGLDLRLPAGSTVAVVGENGAGKTTLVKLLSAMYAPTSGRITVDGTDLREIPTGAWRDRIAATFQDFVPFELQAGEAVGVGDLPRVADLAAVERALERAGASDVVDQLGDGLATQLGRSFPDGRELSGGQWQKIALGRGMMRDAPLLLVMDEPTASLDADTEHVLFERYVDAARRSRETTGAITVLVTHRFSTVRAADLIVVLADGVVAESGTHAELMAAGGGYAELFELQARGYA